MKNRHCGDEETEVMDTELEFGSSTCVCTKCGYVEAHAHRGLPCSGRTCPKCGSSMKGQLCKERPP